MLRTSFHTFVSLDHAPEEYIYVMNLLTIGEGFSFSTPLHNRTRHYFFSISKVTWLDLLAIFVETTAILLKVNVFALIIFINGNLRFDLLDFIILLVLVSRLSFSKHVGF